MSPGGQIGSLNATRAVRFSVTRASVLDEGGDRALADAINGRPALAILSPTVDRLYGSTLRLSLAVCGVGDAGVIVIPTGERNKTMRTAATIVATASEAGFSRRGVFVAIGGGVLLDMAAFAASVFRRGVGHIKIGTTLLAQIDAALGVKCAVNVGEAKNLVGAFHAPNAVLTDGAFLATLPPRQIRAGLAEMLKLAIVADELLFTQLLASAEIFLTEARIGNEASALVDRAIMGMLGQLGRDPYEDDLSRPVDFGHTLSPELESATGYELLHGEAVAIDIAYFSFVSNALGLLPDDDLDLILTVLDRLELPQFHSLLADPMFRDRAFSATEAHRGMRLRLPLPTRIGAVTFLQNRADLPEAVLEEAASRAAATRKLSPPLEPLPE